MLEQERQFYDEHLQEWLQKYHNRFVLVKGRELIGTFDTNEEALTEGARRFGLDSFLVRRVEEKQPLVDIPALALGILSANSTRPAPGASARS